MNRQKSKNSSYTYMHNILKHGKYLMLQSFLHRSYPSQSYGTRNSNDILSPYPRVEAILLNSDTISSRFGFEVSDFMNFLRSHPTVKNALVVSSTYRNPGFYVSVKKIFYFFFPQDLLRLMLLVLIDIFIFYLHLSDKHRVFISNALSCAQSLCSCLGID